MNSGDFDGYDAWLNRQMENEVEAREEESSALLAALRAAGVIAT